MTRLEATLPEFGCNAKDRADMEKIRSILHRVSSKAGFNPSQPRNDHGMWTGDNGDRRTPHNSLPEQKPSYPNTSRTIPDKLHPSMSATELERFNRNAPPGTPPEDLLIHPDFGLPRWYVGGTVSRVGNPLTDAMAAVPATRAITSLAKITATEAIATATVLRARAMGRIAAGESSAKIKRAADAVEEFLGGRPNPRDVKINPKGDIVIMKGNKKFRMDVKNPGYKNESNGTRAPEEPHFHLQEFKDGEWQDAGKTHRHYFKKGDLAE